MRRVLMCSLGNEKSPLSVRGNLLSADNMVLLAVRQQQKRHFAACVWVWSVKSVSNSEVCYGLLSKK